MAEVAKTAPAKKTGASITKTAIDSNVAAVLDDMPERPKTIPHRKTERLFVAYAPSPSAPTVVLDVRVYGVKAECLEFAIDQDPPWKWVETAKGESVAEAIKAKTEAR